MYPVSGGVDASSTHAGLCNEAIRIALKFLGQPHDARLETVVWHRTTISGFTTLWHPVCHPSMSAVPRPTPQPLRPGQCPSLGPSPHLCLRVPLGPLLLTSVPGPVQSTYVVFDKKAQLGHLLKADELQGGRAPHLIALYTTAPQRCAECQRALPWGHAHADVLCAYAALTHGPCKQTVVHGKDLRAGRRRQEVRLCVCCPLDLII